MPEEYHVAQRAWQCRQGGDRQLIIFARKQRTERKNSPYPPSRDAYRPPVLFSFYKTCTQYAVYQCYLHKLPRLPHKESQPEKVKQLQAISS